MAMAIDPAASSKPVRNLESEARQGISIEKVDAQSLFKGGNEVRLVFRGAEYRLRVTRQGKLLLTK
jgi:hemin uptake protein HemP